MAEPLTPEVLMYGFTTADDPQISPDGKSIIYTLTNVDAETKRATSQIWRCGIDGGNRHQLTRLGRVNGSPRWSPDGKQIAFVSDRSGESGLYVVPATGPGEAHLLTEYHSGIVAPTWSADGSRIAFMAQWDSENPDGHELKEGRPPRVRVTRRIDYKSDEEGYLGGKRYQIFVVDVVSGERRMITSDPVDNLHPCWSPDGKTLAVGRSFDSGMHFRLALVDVESGESTYITPEGGTVDIWSWSPDGTRILYTGDTVLTAQTDFFLHNVSSGSSTRLTNDLQILPGGGHISSAGQNLPVWLDNHRALFSAVRGGASGLYEISVDTGEIETLHTWEATLSGLTVDDTGRFVVQGYTSFEANGEISVYDTRSQSANVITDYGRTTFAQYPPAGWERIEVQRGDYTIEGWLLKPPDFDPSKKYPVVLDVHGGPQWLCGHAFYPTQQVLATNGFLTVISNPRGSTSYGREFAQQVIQDWGGEDFKDLMAVVDTVLERPYANAQKTGIFGYSYGGYMTAWTIGQTDRFQAAVCGAPCFDLESMYGTSDIGYSFGEHQWGAAPHEAKDWYEAHSPSTFAHRATTPTLIIQGEADERCPIGQGEQMFVALKKANCEVEFARYPGDSHLFLYAGEPAHREDCLRRMLSWFKDHLGEPV